MGSKYSRTGEIAYQTKRIGKLIDEGNYKLAWKVIEEILPKHADDPRLKSQMVCLYLIEKKYEDALRMIEELDEYRNAVTKTELYALLGMEDKEYYMYDKYFRKFNFSTPFFIRDKRYRMLFVYLNSKYNPNFEMPDFLGVNYLEEQIHSYDREKAIDNIKFNHMDCSENDKGYFYQNINIDEMFNYVENFVKNSTVRGELRYGSEVFRFHYPDCGIVRTGEIANGFSAVVALGTKNVIAIHPSRMSILSDTFEYKPVIEVESKKKVKVRSGLDRFNQRYNK